MDYKKSAEQLMYYMVLGEPRGRTVQDHITELTHGELAVLRYLADECDGTNAKGISKQFDINTSRVAAILNSLEKKGYIIRKCAKTDKRMIEVHITAAGRQHEYDKRNQYIEYCAAMLEQLGEDETQDYIHIMKHLSEILTKKS